MARDNPETIAEAAIGPDEIYAIGLVSAEWGYAESLLEFLIWTLAGVDTERGRSITTHLLAVTRPDIAKTLANETLFLLQESPVRIEVISIVGEFDRLRKLRNRIIHAVWQITDPSKIPTSAKVEAISRSIKARGKLEFKEETFSALEIRNTAKEITKLIARIADLLPKFPKLPASRGIGLSEQSLAQSQNPAPDPTQK